ncbi:MAG TPA: Rho termination factor N-terminal domain-containing protein [Longimicrobiales bacterium]|nr:Rho termination factor N-terminal domain-containing protein [Longimicrobiales bacterium]
MKNPIDAAKRVSKRVSREVKNKVKEVRLDRLDTGDVSTPLGERTRQQLYNRARQLGIDGRSKMNKGALVSAIRRSQ